MKLSVVVPFYNEEKNIRLVLEAFSLFYPKYKFELICVNDGSKDSTEDVFDDFQAKKTYPFARFITYSPNQGYGNAIMTGVRSAGGDIVAWTHSDLQTDPADVFRAYETFVEDGRENLIVKGVRVKRPLPQIILSFGMAVISSVILRKRLYEINAQPKVFSKNLIPLLANAPRDFSLDLYLMCQAKSHRYAIKTIDVEFRNRLHGESSWGGSWQNRVKTIRRTLSYIWKLRKGL